jgi:hypothetical protein
MHSIGTPRAAKRLATASSSAAERDRCEGLPAISKADMDGFREELADYLRV